MPNSDIRTFRQGLQSLLTPGQTRPFLCDGNPRKCDVMIVGLNPATSGGLNIWDHWSDERGLNRASFMLAYRKVRKITGVRARLERIVSQLPTDAALETNIYSTPTARAADLQRRHRVSTAFEFLFREVTPSFVFAHSNGAIDFFARCCGVSATSLTPIEATWQGHRFWLMGRPGPLFRAGYDEALKIGSTLATLLRDFRSSNRDLP